MPSTYKQFLLTKKYIYYRCDHFTMNLVSLVAKNPDNNSLIGYYSFVGSSA